ncbi:MAG: hypothetical protein RBU37_20065, partial [Myxococcota bacterium]|nr:hypothetical protein [Myxococcota bacterium]
MMPTLKRSACTHVAYASAVWLALLCIAPAPWASASEDPPEANVEGEWRCAPQTGVWTALPDGGWSIAAALCTPPAEACADFTALSFDAQGKLLELRVAGTPSAYDVCSMKALARLPSFGLFQRGDELFGVDNGSLKIVWHYVFAPVDNVQTHGSHQLALLSSNSFLLLTEKDGAIQVQRVDELNGLQELRWMGETRLVAVTADAFEWWELAAGGKLGPRSRSLAPAPPKAGDYVIDPIGVMLSPRGSTMVASMRFDSGEWVRISLNATESSRGAAGEPGISVAVASDGAVTNLVARMGTVLRKRFEHRYWKLSEKDLLDEEGAQRQLVTGIGSTLILDGGVSEPKALLIDASEMTWKMRSILRYEAPGRFLNITERQLWTFHPSGAHPFIAWELATGASAQRIPVSQLEEAGMSRPVHASILSREGWLWSSDENAGIALLDLPNATLSKPLLANQGEHFSLDAELGTGVIFARQRGEEVLAWDFLGFDGGHSALRPSGEAKDALDMSERWFPYCATDTLCPKTQLSFEPRPETPQTAQDWALVPPIERGTHWALLIAIGAILIALATLIWRRRVGQKGQLEHELPIAPDGAAEGPSLMARLALLKVTALVDPRGRRFLTAKDYDGFVRKGALGAILRLGLGLGLGLAIAAGLSYAKLLDQAP